MRKKETHYVPQMFRVLGVRYGDSVCGFYVHSAYGDKLTNRRGAAVTCGRCRKTNKFLKK